MACKSFVKRSTSQGPVCSECGEDLRGHGRNHSAAPSFFLLDPFEKDSGLGYQAEEFTAVPQPGGNVPTQPQPSLTHGSNNDLLSRRKECAKTWH